MATGIKSWSTTAGDNDNADSSINWLENQAPSTVNNSARAMMAAIRTQYNQTEWRDWGHTVAYASATTFTIAGTDVTSIYTVGRAIHCTDATELYGFVTNSSFSTDTTVTVALDSGSLSASLASVELGPETTNPSIAPYSIKWGEGANVASATDCNIWASGDGHLVHVTGTTTITDWGTAPAAGNYMWVIFDGAAQLTYNSTTNDLNTGGANYTTSAGDMALIYARSASSYKVTIFPYNGASLSTPLFSNHPVYSYYGDESDGAITRSVTGNESPGILQCTNYTINGGVTMTVNSEGAFIVLATGTITIAGTLTAVGAGGAAGSTPSGVAGNGSSPVSPYYGDLYLGGTGGGGGGASTTYTGAAGGAGFHGLAGGTGGAAAVAGGAGNSLAAALQDHFSLMNPTQLYGGTGGGGAGHAGAGGANQPGAGGGVIILIAPTINFTGTITSAGAPGSGTSTGNSGGGGGGGGGVVIAAARTYTAYSGTVTVSGGAGGSGDGSGANGGAGGAGYTYQITVV